MTEMTVNDGVLQYRRRRTRWLSTGWRGGYCTEPAAHNVSVPEEWERVDLDAYGRRRRERAGFDTTGPTLFTGVDLSHARGARCGPVEAVTTAGISNPATLPMNPEPTADTGQQAKHHPGTVNIILTTSRALTDGALTTLLAGVVEAKAATLLATTNVTGTTTDAVVVGCDRDGSKQPFAGSATTVGAAARACVRESIRASLRSRYPETPPTPETAPYGVTTTRKASLFDV